MFDTNGASCERVLHVELRRSHPSGRTLVLHRGTGEKPQACREMRTLHVHYPPGKVPGSPPVRRRFVSLSWHVERLVPAGGQNYTVWCLTITIGHDTCNCS